MSSTTVAPLSGIDVLRLADALRLVHAGARISWVTDGSKDVHTGVLRHVVDASGSALFSRPGQDIRDTWVRVTLTSGSDRWISLSDLAAKLATGEAAER